jgi:hypothetical protein
VNQDSNRLDITVAGRSVHVELMSLISALSVKPGAAIQPAQAAVPLLDSAGVRAGTLIVFSITGDSEPGRFHVSHLDGLLLLDRADVR